MTVEASKRAEVKARLALQRQVLGFVNFSERVAGRDGGMVRQVLRVRGTVQEVPSTRPGRHITCFAQVHLDSSVKSCN
jgi:hypothetical protein